MDLDKKTPWPTAAAPHQDLAAIQAFCHPLPVPFPTYDFPPQTWTYTCLYRLLLVHNLQTPLQAFWDQWACRPQGHVCLSRRLHQERTLGCHTGHLAPPVSAMQLDFLKPAEKFTITRASSDPFHSLVGMPSTGLPLQKMTFSSEKTLGEASSLQVPMVHV